MPSNLCEFFNFVKGHSPPVQEVLHLYCPGCFAHKVKKDDDCVTEGCSVKDGNSFCGFPLADQIRFMFEEGGLAFTVEEYHKLKGLAIQYKTFVMDLR